MLILLAPLFIWLSPFVYFVKFNSLPLGQPEFYCLLATMIGVSLLSSALLWRAGWIRLTLVLAFLVALSLSFLPEFQSGLWLKVAFFTVIGLAILLNRKILPAVTFMSGIFFAATLLFSVGKQFDTVSISQKTAVSKKNLPLFIHIVFDEHMGPNAIPTNIGLGKTLQKQITHFYPAYGFRLYSNAYSRYSRTYDSIPNLLNFIPQAQDSYYFPGGAEDQILQQNKAFELLSQLGYKLRVYQPNYIDFCHAKKVNYEACYSYPIFSFKNFYQLNISWQQRYQYILKSYVFSSLIYQELLYIYAFDISPFAADMHFNLPRAGWDQDQLSTLATLAALHQLQQDVILHAHDGTAFFAHILLPHSPYIYDENCQINAKPVDWLINYDFGVQGNTAARRAVRYQLYDKQSLCLYRQLQGVFSAWQQAGVFDKAVIIMQGDHSSRLSVVAPTIERQGISDQQDFNDAYPALFAVKAPFYQAGINSTQVPITYLFGQVMQQLSGQNFPVDTNLPYVFLTDERPNNFKVQPKEAIAAFKP